MSKELRTVSAVDFAKLKDGVHHFAIRGSPEHPMQPVTLQLYGARSKLRQACFDLFGTEWNILPEAVEAFSQDYRSHLRSRSGLFKWNKVQLPSGHSQLTFSIIRGEEGDWLYKAAQFVTDERNLGSIAATVRFGETLVVIRGQSSQ